MFAVPGPGEVASQHSAAGLQEQLADGGPKERPQLRGHHTVSVHRLQICSSLKLSATTVQSVLTACIFVALSSSPQPSYSLRSLLANLWICRPVRPQPLYSQCSLFADFIAL